ncbi:hypothetical protein Drorol1_Dr00004050 [Drosera rotundifolia]
MANGTESEEFVVLSKVRAGHKREFEFALRSQNEIASCLGRSRARKRKGNDVAEKVRLVKNGVSEVYGVNGLNGEGKSDEVEEGVEAEAKSDVVDATSDDENRSRSVESRRENVDGDAMNVGGGEAVVQSCGSGKRVKVGDGEDEQKKVSKRSNLSDSELSLKQAENNENSSPKDTSDGIVEAETVEQDSGVHVGTLSEKVSIKAVPKKLKDLLDTGLLEGMTVRYKRGLKMRAPGDLGLLGVISGCGILCYCDGCQGTNVIAPSLYEVHAGSSNKRAADYIYLENGNTLRDVLNTCKRAKLDALEAIIRQASGGFREGNSTSCKASASKVCPEQSMKLPDSIMDAKDKEAALSHTPVKRSGVVDADIAKKSSGSSAKPRSYGTKSQGRVTRKDLHLHKLVFEGGVLPDGTEVGYYSRGKKLLSGYKKGSGIFCMCCQTEISPSQFEAHAGCSSRRSPYQHIYISSGVSLHELSISLSLTRESPAEEHDKLCGICYDEGDLRNCNGCRRAFHTECVSVQIIPSGKWYCRYCVNKFEREQLVKNYADSIAAGRLSGVDPLEQISRRCVRVVKTLESESSCCVLCRGHDFSTAGFGPKTVIICDQCEKEYHVGCLRSHNIQELKELPQGKWFCSTDCNKIHSVLHQLIRTGEQELPGSLLEAISKKHEDKETESDSILIKWRLLSGKTSSTEETRVLLANAVSVLHERFDPILGPDSGQDLIPHMVYGRDQKDLELGGMYCAILSVKSIVVSALVFRIFGREVAEIPLVATSSNSQGKGYFQALYACIESLLRDLEVNNLLLPATTEARSLWTDRFGFSEIQQEKFDDIRKSYNVMAFDGTTLLLKSVPKLWPPRRH